MSDRLFAATRKGLFRWDCDSSGKWCVAHTCFLGDPVTTVLPDPRDRIVYAALNLGHFGVKLHRSSDGGAGAQSTPCSNRPSLCLRGVLHGSGCHYRIRREFIHSLPPCTPAEIGRRLTGGRSADTGVPSHAAPNCTPAHTAFFSLSDGGVPATLARTAGLRTLGLRCVGCRLLHQRAAGDRMRLHIHRLTQRPNDCNPISRCDGSDPLA